MQKFLILLSFLTYTAIWSQKLDSITLSNSFKSYLTAAPKENVNQQISQLKTIFFDKSEQHKMWFWTELTKYYIQLGKLEDAKKIAETGLSFWKSRKNKSRQATFYNLLGSIESLQKSYQKAIQAYQNSIELYELTGNEKSAAYVKNNIANTFFSLSDYESAFKYISQAHKVVLKYNDTLYLPSITGILAISEVKLGKFESGKKHADECIRLSEKHQNLIGIIIGNYTLGEYWTAKKNFPLAIQKFEKSLSIAQQYQQLFYVMLAKIGISHAANENQDFDIAYQNGIEALNISKILENQNVKYSIFKNLADASFGLNNSSEAYLYLAKAHNLFRSSTEKTNRKIINDILIQYESAKKEKTIVESRLKLQEETLAGNKLKYLIVILSIVILGIILSAISQWKIQKQRVHSLELQKKKSLLLAIIDGEERERERISTELHDGLASTITGIKIGLETTVNAELTSLSKAIIQLKKLHEETRRISHNLMPLDLEKVSLIEAIERFCVENSTSKTQIHVHATKEINLSISPSESRILYRIIQEIIHNVMKHAQAQNCSIQFQANKKQTIVTIEDDGIGFDVQTKSKNQGLQSMQKRIADLGGTFQLESSPNKGCFIMIELNGVNF